jgi:threonine aldolase
MDFRSDNVSGASPEIVDAIVRANRDFTTSYGDDGVTARLRRRCCELFETEVDVVPVMTGTAANALSIASITPPWGAALAHTHAHMLRDEWNAPEFFSGARVVPVRAAAPTLTAADLHAGIEDVLASDVGVPSSVTVTQASEAGTVYRVEDLQAISAARCRADFRLAMHMDGARFANAAAFLGCAPADVTWRAGVDLMSFGATKNGAVGAEMIVIFRRELAAEVRHRARRAGHRLSKMRFVSAQLEAYLADDLWLRNARHANAMAARLAAGVTALHPVEANSVFIRIPEALAQKLQDAGFRFTKWGIFGRDVYRFVCSWQTEEKHVDALVVAVKGL